MSAGSVSGGSGDAAAAAPPPPRRFLLLEDLVVLTDPRAQVYLQLDFTGTLSGACGGWRWYEGPSPPLSAVPWRHDLATSAPTVLDVSRLSGGGDLARHVFSPESAADAAGPLQQLAAAEGTLWIVSTHATRAGAGKAHPWVTFAVVPLLTRRKWLVVRLRGAVNWASSPSSSAVVNELAAWAKRWVTSLGEGKERAVSVAVVAVGRGGAADIGAGRPHGVTARSGTRPRRTSSRACDARGAAAASLP
jgi:hypothetical protein